MTLFALAEGVATLLTTAGIADKTGASPSLPAIHLGPMRDQPDKVVALFPYTVTHDTSFEDTVVGLQVKVRAPGYPTVATGIADQIFNALQNARNLTVNGIPVERVEWSSGLTPDISDERAVTTDTYFFHTHKPTTYRGNT